MTVTQQAALAEIPDDDLLVDRAELAATLHEPPAHGEMSTALLALYLVATIAVTVVAAIAWSATH
jgi:hypothetical protein